MSTQVENVHSISITCNEMDTVQERTESITLTIKEEEEEEKEEEEEEEEEDDSGSVREYKRMDLKGESESDKDLIIYSLNESLQIHKEIVERTQNEKDDIEDQFEQERSQIENERIEIESKRNDGNQQLSKLESIYKSLTSELEAKKLDYHRMETRFHSHVKSTKTQDLTIIYTQLNQMISQITNLCVSTIHKENVTDYIMNDCFIDNSMIQQHFIQPLDPKDISILIEKYIMDIIMNEIFKTTIHPGVSLNNSFGIIHDWIEKRNISWASRLKQQISYFLKQSNEQLNEIELAKQQIKQKILDFLSHLYDNIHLLEENVISIINQASELNLLLKSQENEIEIIPINQGTQFNENIMTSVNPQADHVLFVISPPFVANEGFIIPAKVYCV